MNTKRLFFTLITASILSLSGITNCNAQNAENQFWGNYSMTVPVNEKWSYGGDVGIRGFISNYDWNQFLIRPRATYRFNYALSASGAVAWFNTMNRDAGNVNEFRIHQQLNLKWPDLGFIEFFYRARFEQRFFVYQDGPNQFDLRMRGLIGVESQDIKIFNSKRPIFFLASLEGFTTVNKEVRETFVNQTRVDFAFGHRLSEKLRYELHYILQGSRLGAEDGDQASQNIYRIRVFHRLTERGNE